MRNPCELYRRWRHTRGFGIHSPFAYRLVTEAIRPSRGYAYYREHDPGMSAIHRLRYRLDIFLRQEVGDAPVTDLRAWLASPTRPLLLIREVAGAQDDTQARIEAILRDSGSGLLILSRRYLLAIPRPEMTFTKYLLL